MYSSSSVEKADSSRRAWFDDDPVQVLHQQLGADEVTLTYIRFLKTSENHIPEINPAMNATELRTDRSKSTPKTAPHISASKNA